MSAGATLEDLIAATLQVAPGLTAREIGYVLRKNYGLSVYRYDINSILYSHVRDGMFRKVGDSPPIWFAGAEDESSSDDEALWSDDLHDWQREALDAWWEAGQQGIVEAATGTGKSRLGVEVIRTAMEDDLQSLVIVPTIALQRQWARVIEAELGFEVDSFLGGGNDTEFDRDAPVTVGVVNSVAGKAEELGHWFEVVVADECHNYASDVFRNALFDGAERRLGLTATLARQDNGVDEVLLPYFDGLVYKYGLGDALEDDVISPYRVLAIGVRLNPTAQHKYEAAGSEMGKARQQLRQLPDYPSDESEGEFMKWVARVAKNQSHEGVWPARRYLKFQRERREILSTAEEKTEAVCRLGAAIGAADGALVFTEAIASADRVAEALQAADIAVGVYHTDQDMLARIEVLDGFRAGELSCVVAVEALDEGIDVPDANLGVVVAGTRQQRQMIQRIGRVIRKKRHGGEAAFIVLYAMRTAEDPDFSESASDNLEMLYKHAKEWERIDLRDWPGERLSLRVRQWLGV